MKKLVIIGVGGFGREVAWLVERINEKKPTWDLVGFIDDNEELIGKNFNSYTVLGNTDWLLERKDDLHAVCAIGSAKIRKQVISKLKDVNFVNLIDPNVIMSEKINIGQGCIICVGTILTVDINIGDHVIINLDCTIGHDAVIKDFVTLYPSVNVSGNTVLEECVEMGTGSQIIQGLTIGNNTFVGAGAVVVKDLPSNCIAVGIPAKSIKINM